MLRRSKIAATAALASWVILACGGVGLLMASTLKPDPAAVARPRMPVGLSLPTVAGKPTLVVCLHPRCPCSDATLNALEKLLDAAPAATALAVFAVPDDGGADWTNAALVQRALLMPRVTVVLDPGGRKCVLLGARSSGQTFLYDAAGRLSFEGGLTPGRGEAGETPGVDYLADHLSGRSKDRSVLRTPVFGCALYRSTRTNKAAQ